MEYIEIFDENNNPTGKVKEKQQAHQDGNIHRTAHVWIINDKNELLLQKRSTSKKTHPNCWDISGAGHIKAGESVVDGAIRELKEELGVEVEEKDLQYIATIKSTKNPKNMEFQYVYLLNCNKEIEEYIFEDNEVSEVKYIFYKDLEKMVEEKIEGLLIHEEEYKYLFKYITNKSIKIRKCNANDVDSIYNIQNMSNIDGAYIYRIRYLDDILATGLTGEDSVWYDEDIITVVTEDGQKKLNIREFIKTEELNKVYENDYLRMEIKDKVIQYEAETYHITVTNRSEYTIVIADFSQENEVTLQAGSQTLSYEKEYSNMMVIRPGETGYYTLMFGKDYDLSSETDSLNLNMVRILKSYTGTEETREEELKNAEAIYSVKIDL